MKVILIISQTLKLLKQKTCRKIPKLLVPWDVFIPKRYKRNIINTDLQRAKNKTKFIAANYFIKFISNVIRMFRQNDNNIDAVEYIIPPNHFEAPKLVI